MKLNIHVVCNVTFYLLGTFLFCGCTTVPPREQTDEKERPKATGNLVEKPTIDTSSLLRQAIEKGDLDAVKRMIRATEIDKPIKCKINWLITNKETSVRFTPLMLAAHYNQSHIIKYLLMLGANPNQNGWFKRGDEEQPRFPIEEAVKNDDVGTVSLMIDKGAKLRGIYGCEPLICAVYTKGISNKMILLLLDKGADVNAKTQDNATPLHAAAQYNTHAVVSLLINKDADVNAKMKDNATPLHLAAQDNTPEVVSLLINKGVDVNAKIQDNATPLHLAAQDNTPEVVSLLIKKGADVEAINTEYCTPLYVAAWEKRIDNMKVLIENGADVDFKPPNGKTAFQALKDKGGSEADISMLRNLAQERKAIAQKKQWEILLSKYEEAFKRGELKKAISILEQAISHDVGGVQSQQMLSEILQSPEWQAQRPKICVQKFDISQDISPGMTRILYNTLIGELTASQKYTVVDWEQLERVNKFVSDSQPNLSIKDAKKQAMSQMGVNQLYVGSVDKYGTEKIQYEMTVKILNFDLVVVASYQDTVGSEEEMKDCIKRIAEKIIYSSGQ